MLGTIINTYYFDIESTNKTCKFFNKVARTFVQKNIVILGSQEINAINHSDIYDILWDL